jgi:hypothetical protein
MSARYSSQGSRMQLAGAFWGRAGIRGMQAKAKGHLSLTISFTRSTSLVLLPSTQVASYGARTITPE